MRIIILPGDGIGPEIMAATEEVLRVADKSFGLGLKLEHRAVGFESLAAVGTTVPAELLDVLREADGVIMGPTDTAAYPPPEKGGINPSATIRGKLDLYANIRPSRAIPGVPALRPELDLVVVRENTEGFYADRNMHLGSGEFMPTPDVALAVRKITRKGSERIARAAFELAMTRKRHLIAVHKANVLKVSDGLFLECVHKVAKDFPAVTLEEMHVDAAASALPEQPERFDVMVTTNMFGDILSNLAASLSGGLGLAASLNMGDERAIAQASHGSAPDIAGKGIANPTALLGSTSLLLRWLGERHQQKKLVEAGAAIDRAIDAVLAAAKHQPADLGGSTSTTDFGKAVAQALA